MRDFYTFVLMNKRNFFRTLISLVLVFFLFAPILLGSLSGGWGGPSKHNTLAKSSGSHTKSDSQFLFEEKEKEEKGTENALSMLPIMYEVATLSTSSTDSIILFPTIDHVGFFFDTPIYLSKRSLLI